jgi:hypothetical protein
VVLVASDHHGREVIVEKTVYVMAVRKQRQGECRKRRGQDIVPRTELFLITVLISLFAINLFNLLLSSLFTFTRLYACVN